jgi:hypothetical protein
MQVGILSTLNMVYRKRTLSTGKGNAQYLDLADDVACGAPFQLYGAGNRGGAGCDQHLWTCGTPNLISTVCPLLTSDPRNDVREVMITS